MPLTFRPEVEIKASHTPLILHVVIYLLYYNFLHEYSLNANPPRILVQQVANPMLYPSNQECCNSLMLEPLNTNPTLSSLHIRESL
jgi:hypothetical protein